MRLIPSHTLALAEQVIQDSFIFLPSRERQRLKVAKAHYTLAQNHTLSLAETKLHLNSCISILQNIKKKGYLWSKNIAIAYYKRAEVFESEDKLEQAILDYKHTIGVLNTLPNLTEDNYALLAECHLSIADLLVYMTVENKDHLLESYYHAINAIRYLLKTDNYNEDLFVSLSYAHQTAAIAISEININEAIKNFKAALNILYNYNIIESTATVSENFRYLGILYNLKSIKEPIYPFAAIYEECSLLYSCLSSLLEYNPEEDEGNLFEHITNHAAKINNNPYTTLSVICETIDNFIYILQCLQSKDMILEYVDYYAIEKEKCIELLQGILKNLILRSHYIMQEGSISKTFDFIFEKKFDIYNIALHYLNSTPCKIYSFAKKHRKRKSKVQGTEKI